MSNDYYIVSGDSLRGIANKIREKGDTSEQLIFPQGFIDAIDAISGDEKPITTYLTYASYDGSTIYKTVTCLDGTPQESAPSNPSRPSTATNSYSFVGWSKNMNSTTADADAQTDVIADRTIYAAYTAQARTYTVRFYNGSTLLETDTGVPYGGSTTYNGATPVSPDGSATDYPFEGWLPTPTNIQGDTSCYAQFGSPVEDVEITDSWDTIIANIDNGTYKTVYKIGNYKPLDLGTEGTINMQIVAFDSDVLASGGYAPITFVGKELLASTHAMRTSSRESGEATAWETSEMRTYLTSTVLPLIPSNVRSRLNTVKKYSDVYSNGSITKDSLTLDALWIPNMKEVFSTQSGFEDSGASYGKIYSTNNSRIKYRPDGQYKGNWWLRSSHNSGQHSYITDTGSGGSQIENMSYYRVCLGFCLGLESETITDTWAEIFAAEQDGTYSTKYAIGDTKMLDLGTEGQHLMEIVAFDTDDKADGSGKAKITWISKDLLATTHRMNPSRTANTEGTGSLGGWEKSEMRTYLKETIKPLIPETVRNAIVPVTKVQNAYQASDETNYQQTTNDDVWIPGHGEIFNSTSYDQSGAVYSGKFIDANSRIKKRSGSASDWWLRAASSAYSFRFVNSNGYDNQSSGDRSRGVALGFCT